MAPATWNEDPPDAARRIAAALAAVVLFVLLVSVAASALAQEPAQLSAQLSGYRGVDVFDAACHVKGEGGAPRTGDKAAWLPRTVLGIDPLVRAAARGHGGMPPRAGKASLTDAELRSAVIYMASSASKRAAQN